MIFSNLNNSHDRAAFDCGVPELNAFLKNQASQYIKRGLCAVHVFAEGYTIVGYYTLSISTMSTGELPNNTARKYPSNLPVPCWLLGRLAVDRKYQGQGIGERLLMAACNKVLEMARDAGGYCIVVDAKNHDIKKFYLKYGFTAFPASELRLFLPLTCVKTNQS